MADVGHSIYLAGPISGLTYAGATDWRQYVADHVRPGIHCLSPMRGKDYLKDWDKMPYVSEHPLSTSHAINTRDHWDVSRCDAVFVNLLQAEKPSYGTVMEIAWAHAYGKPVVLVMESGGMHTHPMIHQCCAFRAYDIDAGIEIVNALFATTQRSRAAEKREYLSPFLGRQEQAS